LVKIVVAEDGSDAMTEFYYSTGHKEKIVSAMAALEVRSALNRLRREGAISAEAVSSVMEFLTA
jgi:hypothetical protein